MNKRLQVLPVKNAKNLANSKKLDNIPPPLLRPEFLMVIVGPVRSGKGNLLVNILENKNFGYKQYFDDIIYISPTIENDVTGRAIKADDSIMKITDNLDDIDLILSSIVELQQKKETIEPTLIVLDDMLGLIKSTGHSYFSNLCSKYRHWKLSLIITTQSFRSIPVVCRYNATGYIIFKTHNKKEFTKLEEELEGNFPKFEELYDQATEKKYEFLFLDMEKIKAYKNFDTILYEK
jgi:hypothetical protein